MCAFYADACSMYDRNYSVFKGLYKANAGAFRKLNA